MPQRATLLLLALNPALKLEFVRVPAGSFDMGCANVARFKCDSDEYPVHKVTITRDFWLQTTPITQRQWQLVMGNTPSRIPNCADCPVENISWNDTQIFIARLTEQDPPHKYRLPTEAEWEYAARAGTRSVFPWGNENFPGKRSVPFASVSPVKSRKANAWGLYDMHGHIWQWVQDWYLSPYPSEKQSDPVGPPSGTHKVARGGGPWHEARHSSSSSRHADSPDTKANGAISVRLIREKKN